MDAAHRFRIRNATYRRAVKYTEGEDILEQPATRDLKALVEADLLVPQGEKRGRIYLAGPAVMEAVSRIRSDRTARSPDDPFNLIRSAHTPLPLGG